jgi:nucleotide-binding universal stress UspA family protein
MGIEKVVVGMDFSTPAVDAAQWAAQHFAPDVELVLAHVIDLPRTPSFLRRAAPSPLELEAAARDFAEARLQDLATFVTAGRTRTVVRVGRPHEELAALAEETGADLVLIGPHEVLAATGLGEHRVELVVTFGNAGDATLKVARDTAADLIVMGLRGSGAVVPAILVSTVSTVLHGARCPVLVVTEEQDAV